MTAKRAVRSLKPTHLVALRALDGRPSCMQITALSWPRVEEGEGRLPFWSLLSHSVTHHAGRRRAWVYIGEEGIQGVVVARVRCGGLVWDVRYLWAEEGRDEVVQELLNHVREDAAQRGARRIFIDLPLDEAPLTLAQRVGFQPYTEAALFRLGETISAGEGWPPRERQRGDEHALFQLYTAAVPAAVRAAEAMTLEEWAALHKGTRRWSPRQLTERQQYVWEVDGGLAAWAELAISARSQHLEWLVQPDHEGECDALVAAALAKAQPRGAVYATCHAYQQPLRSALERAGFELVTEFAVLVSQLAIRVPERVLVAAPVRSILGG